VCRDKNEFILFLIFVQMSEQKFHWTSKLPNSFIIETTVSIGGRVCDIRRCCRKCKKLFSLDTDTEYEITIRKRNEKRGNLWRCFDCDV